MYKDGLAPPFARGVLRNPKKAAGTKVLVVAEGWERSLGNNEKLLFSVLMLDTQRMASLSHEVSAVQIPDFLKSWRL